jgi:hypothetical protein
MEKMNEKHRGGKSYLSSLAEGPLEPDEPTKGKPDNISISHYKKKTVFLLNY